LSSCAAVLLLALACAPAARVQQPAVKKRSAKMESLFTDIRDDRPISLPAAPREIHPLKTPLRLEPAAPGAEESIVRAFVNGELNSRLAAAAGALPKGPESLRVRWQAVLKPGMRPRALLSAGGNLLVVCDSGWQLLNRNGGAIQAGRLRDGSVAVIDPAKSLFIGAGDQGTLHAWRMTDGGLAYGVMPTFGDDFQRLFIAPIGSRLALVSTEIWRDPGTPEPNRSMIEIIDVAHAQPITPAAPSGALVVDVLVRPSRLLLAAMHAGSIALATDNYLCLLDLDLKIQQVFTGAFEPLAMSLDEAGRMYVVAQVNGRAQLWLVTPKGDRSYSFALPEGITSVNAPPIVGYDHTVYLLAGRLILAVGQNGKLLWQHSASAPIGGAVAMADGRLLVAEGDAVAVFDGEGGRRVVYSIPGHPLMAAPILTSGGELLLLTRDTLYSVGR
jgi:hypothetical protein